MKDSASWKIASIALVILVLMIPAAMISDLLNERESRRDSVVQEINQKWGNSQTITGPFFTIPYKLTIQIKIINRQFRLIIVTFFRKSFLYQA